MRRAVVALLFGLLAAPPVFALLAAPPALAEAPEAYGWTGYGLGPARCAIFRLTVGVVVDGPRVTGRFGLDNRVPQLFAATLGGDGAFRTKVDFGAHGPIEISGTLRDGAGEVVLDGFRGQRCICRFEARLAPAAPRLAAATP